MRIPTIGSIVSVLPSRWVGLLLVLGLGCGGSSSSGGADASMHTGGASGSGGVPTGTVPVPEGGTTGGPAGLSGTITGGALGSGGSVGNGGIVETGGIGSGGARGSGGVLGGIGGATSAACSPACTADQDCVGGSCVPSQWYGTTCTTTKDCPANMTCDDGSNESFDGTRLPAGDGTNPGEFTVSTDGLTVTDTITGLVWQRDGSGTRSGCSGGNLTCFWAEAKAYCAGLVLGGLSGWRLPARHELLTIVDFAFGIANPSIDPTAFPDTPSDFFWTSSPYAGSSDYAWYVYFSSGTTDYLRGGNILRVRCVR